MDQHNEYGFMLTESIQEAHVKYSPLMENLRIKIPGVCIQCPLREHWEVHICYRNVISKIEIELGCDKKKRIYFLCGLLIDW